MISIERSLDDDLIISQYREHWLDMGLHRAEIRDDWQTSAERFLHNARIHNQLVSYVALDEDTPVGSANCHVTEQRYPAFRTMDAERCGYLWGVYVHPQHRGNGIGSMLIDQCLVYLKEIGCARATLHAGQRSTPLYLRHGFETTDELSRTI